MLFHTLTAAHRLHAMQMPTNVGFTGGWGKRRRRKTTEWQVTSRWLSKTMLMKSLLFIYSVKTVVRRELQEKHSSQWLGDCPMSWTELKSSLNGINQGGIMGNYTIEKISHDFGTGQVAGCSLALLPPSFAKSQLLWRRRVTSETVFLL